MTERRSRRNRWRTIGRSPQGDHVRRRFGTSCNPASSTKTRSARRSSASFPQAWPLLREPRLDPWLVPLDRPSFGLLWRPSMLTEQATNVTGVVAHIERALDQRGDPLRGPQLVRVSVRPGTLAKRPQEHAPLNRGEVSLAVPAAADVGVAHRATAAPSSARTRQTRRHRPASSLAPTARVPDGDDERVLRPIREDASFTLPLRISRCIYPARRNKHLPSTRSPTSPERQPDAAVLLTQQPHSWDFRLGATRQPWRPWTARRTVPDYCRRQEASSCISSSSTSA